MDQLLNYRSSENKQIIYKLVGQDEADIKKISFFLKVLSEKLYWKRQRRDANSKYSIGEKNFEILDVDYI